MASHHDAHIDHVVVVALEHHRDDVLADVVHITLDRGYHHLALGLDIAPGRLVQTLFFLDVGNQVRHRLLHDARTFHHLRQEHLALTKEIAHDIHAGHQWTFNHVQRAPSLGQHGLVGLFGIHRDEVGDAMHHGMAEPLLDRRRVFGGAAPCQSCALVLGRALGALGNFHQALAGVGAAVQHHVFDALAQDRLQLVIDANHAGVDDAHVHAGGDGVVQKDRVNRFAHRVVATKRKTHVGDATRDLGAGQVLLDPARRVDEVDRVVVVLLDAGGNGEDIGVEDDVFRWEVDLVHQNPVGALADANLALITVGLALFVKRHHHGGRAITTQQAGLALELVHPFLHADRIHHRLALHTAQPGFDHTPLGGVDHHRHPGNIGLGGNQVEEAHHGGLAVEHGLVHVDVDDLRAVFHLLARHGQRLLELAVQNHAGKDFGTGDIGALTDVDKRCTGWTVLRANAHRLQAGQSHGGNKGIGHASHL